MAENEGPPLIKKEQDIDDDDEHVWNIGNNMKGISIAERRAAKCGFNNEDVTCNALAAVQVRSPPYVTIPSGISPSALLDSPMLLLPNAQAQLSPTTGTFHQFPLSPNPESLELTLKHDEEDDDNIEAITGEPNSVSVNHNLVRKSVYSCLNNPESLELTLKHNEEDDDNIEAITGEPNSVSVNHNLTFEKYFEYPKAAFQETRKTDCFEDALAKSEGRVSLQQQQPNDNTQNTNGNQELKHHHQKAVYIPKEVAKHSEDGFYWRKYGQKHVKGSESPRSYYKCTNANCLVKKKVERSHAGEITQIVYKGSHNHPIPQPLNNRRPTDMPAPEMTAGEGGGGTSFKAEEARVTAEHQWMPDNGCLVGAINSSASILSEFPDNNPLPVRNFDQPPVETAAQDISSNTFGSQDGEDRTQASPESISYKDEDDENNNAESEPKKRKRGNLPENETTIPRSGRESKVVVQIESDVDILDDGYRWRKYGQKVVKGNPNPRSYYKCTTPRCPVRKHVERAADDIKSVLTTYEGKHNHEVPASKTRSLAISDASNQLQQAVTNNIGSNSSPMAQKPDHASKAGKQAQDNLPLYMERKPILSYNDFMRSNLSGNFPGHHHDLGGFGAPASLFPYSFPPFPSLAYNTLLMNGNNNHMKPYSSSSSKFYQMMPSDYMLPMPSQMSHHVNPGGPAAAHMGGNFAFNNYTPSALQNPTRGQQADQMRECQVANVVKPKEEQTADEGESYDHTCLSIPNHGNGSL